jgi:hypothetical protein
MARLEIIRSCLSKTQGLFLNILSQEELRGFLNFAYEKGMELEVNRNMDIDLQKEFSHRPNALKGLLIDKLV